MIYSPIFSSLRPTAAAVAIAVVLSSVTAAQTSAVVTVSATAAADNQPDDGLANPRDQFAIQTTVSIDGKTEQSFRTIFRDGIAVQITGDGSRFLTIYDDDHVTMLDRKKGIASKISHQQLINITDQTATMIRGTARRESLGVDVKPRRIDDVYVADFGPFHYRISSIASPAKRLSGDYSKTADAAARLNLVRSTGLPPFGRLAISRELVRDDRVPIRTELTIRRDPEDVQTLVSVNEIKSWNDTDQDRFDAAMSMRAIYQFVGIDQFEPF